MDSPARSFEERLNAQPQLKERVAALLAIVEDASAAMEQADEAERRVIAAVRRLGNEAVSSWAARQEGLQRSAASEQGAARAFRGRFFRRGETRRHSRESGNPGKRPTVVVETPGRPPARA